MSIQVVIALVVWIVSFACGMIFLKKWPIGLLLILSSVLAALASGFGFPIRHIVEGMFTYFNIIFICATGAIFLKSIEESGAAAAMTKSLVLWFYRTPALLILVMMLLLLVPGMLTGIAVNSILSVGVLVAPIMIGLGIPRVTTAVIIGLGSIMSMIMPPTNLLAMSIAMGINAPFEGFTLPSLFVAVPLTVLCGLILGLPHVKKVELDALLKVLPDDHGLSRSFRPWLPLLSVVAIMIAMRSFPKSIHDIGTPLTFAIGTVIAVFSGHRFNLGHTIRKAMSGPMLSILELLVGIGTFVQIATLTGIRGLLVTASLSLPSWLAYPAAALTLLVSGGLLSPFAPGRYSAYLSFYSFSGGTRSSPLSRYRYWPRSPSFPPPTAIAGRFAADVAGVADYKKVWKASLVPVGLLALIALGVLAGADQFAKFLKVFAAKPF